MAKIQVGGAGGAPANNFILSLRKSHRNDYLIGTSCVSSDLFLADVNEKYVVPPAMSEDYPSVMLRLLKEVQPDLIHLQHDFEVRAISRLREDLEAIGVKYFLPAKDTIENCVDKGKSYEIWHAAGIKVPKSILLKDESDLKKAFHQLGEKIWIRAVEGGGGQGALPVDQFEFAKIWIDRFNGWGNFTAAECLTPQSVTWLSIWHEGVLVVAQTRKRRSWNFGNRTLSGITGITGVGETYSHPDVNQVALDANLSIDNAPNGIFAVDMTYDRAGWPKPTEINIGRFFTTHYFFTCAGLNMPEIYCDIALENEFPSLEKTINPLPDGLIWIRGMDVAPVLTTSEELKKMESRTP